MRKNKNENMNKYYYIFFYLNIYHLINIKQLYYIN